MRLTNLAERLESDDLLRGSVVSRQTMASQEARYCRPEPFLPKALKDCLAQQGISELYSHQAEALEEIRSSHDVVVVTPTSSGKSLTYILPLLEHLLEHPDATSLLLFPLKALEQDQFTKLQVWKKQLEGELEFTLSIFDGDTPAAERQRIKKRPPNILISNPDMLHQGLLAYHQSWERFLKNLRFVVIDELHAYRGVFGSHIVQVLRRLQRLLHYYGASPQFICLSATVSNPSEFAASLIGRPVQAIDQSGAPMPEREFSLINSQTVSLTQAIARVFTHCLDAGLKTIAFTKSRVATEIVYRSLCETRPDLSTRISAYRAGYLPEDRRKIEQSLQDGTLDGVISTSALEMGIDIGGLDVCILGGFPGSMMSLWQRAGRVGRRGERAAIVLIAGSDQLDQYFARESERLLSRPLERALINSRNEHILRQHLPAAAAEIPLMEDDPYIVVEEHADVISALEQSRDLLRSASGQQWFPGRPRPHANVSLRNVGGTFEILDISRDKEPVIGTVSGNAVFRECHDGAVYLHRGEPYRVEKLDLKRSEVHVVPHRAATYTMIRTQKETEILDVAKTDCVRSFVARLGLLRVTEHFVAYERRRLFTQELLSVEPLELPPQSFVTVGCWIELPELLPHVLAETDLHFMGSIHALEHAAISLTPLLALCDRNDLGGISFTKHPQLPNGAVFFYDGYPGGVGIAECMHDNVQDLLERTLQLIRYCPCEEGCPSCIQSPKCGSGNRPLDKTGATAAVELLLSEAIPTPTPSSIRIADGPHTEGKEQEPWSAQHLPEDRRVVVFDLETQLSAKEVGGWRQARQMRIAIAAVWDSMSGTVTTYDESEVEALIAHLDRADLVCGFNIRSFDYEVLRGYSFRDFQKLPTLDLLEVITAQRGGRLKLDSIAKATLGIGKSADGLQSLEWFKNGEIERVREYCIKDVEATRDVLLHALENGQVLFQDKGGASVELPVRINLEMYLTQQE
ncbi:MAG: DEAD/DEAH box helicase [Calditrichaeota bacterium]|nr:DEAD/DEAH box helicase [Calditrichota bacterium]MCB9391170.1 DEAD/DEAH box helicase [Calditrichota bacterium]